MNKIESRFNDLECLQNCSALPETWKDHWVECVFVHESMVELLDQGIVLN